MLLFLGFNKSARYATIIGEKKMIMISKLQEYIKNELIFITRNTAALKVLIRLKSLSLTIYVFLPCVS